MTLDELTEAVARGAVDTVLLAMTDMQGRLQGKRLTASHFLSEVAEHGAESCNYLLAVDVDMTTVDGYAMSSWERGYGDMLLVPDLDTLRAVPWQEGTVVCLADVAWPDGSDVVASPRQILHRQLARLAEHGWNSSSVPAFALQPCSARRASWWRRIWRGEARTSEPSGQATSARHTTVPSCHGTGRSVSRSGSSRMSP